MKNYRIEIKWAIVYVIVSFIWIFIQKALGFFDSNISRHVFFSVLIVLVLIPLFYFEQTDKKKNFLNNKMMWKQGFISGCLVIVLATLFVPVLSYVTYELIAPDFFKKAIALYTESGKLNPIDAAARFNLRSSMLQGVSDNLSFGISFSAIMAFFTKSQ
ncbi:hypothetical protein FEDK69T_18490 [Flavobacterium enshiense DK69]|uniref:DUF4199 domain-containing protein n=1 Tax=Flavobacterium enshiense DK69 TaxID=1107311 RepID=V6S7G5_9FLAO|nr:DUF4199 domain-containing protein [Flavobacterium enshiense]ESU22596.1 hypothetical protein FEDK69T_18490 [Flavobacterium enshiense DK69]KGO95692.1 hypothetical protein Q767_10780 [Flavobacterium enshiense DK69]